jgi:hypothetical protein
MLPWRSAGEAIDLAKLNQMHLKIDSSTANGKNVAIISFLANTSISDISKQKT